MILSQEKVKHRAAMLKKFMKIAVVSLIESIGTPFLKNARISFFVNK